MSPGFAKSDCWGDDYEEDPPVLRREPPASMTLEQALEFMRATVYHLPAGAPVVANGRRSVMVHPEHDVDVPSRFLHITEDAWCQITNAIAEAIERLKR